MISFQNRINLIKENFRVNMVDLGAVEKFSRNGCFQKWKILPILNEKLLSVQACNIFPTQHSIQRIKFFSIFKVYGNSSTFSNSCSVIEAVCLAYSSVSHTTVGKKEKLILNLIHVGFREYHFNFSICGSIFVWVTDLYIWRTSSPNINYGTPLQLLIKVNISWNLFEFSR